MSNIWEVLVIQGSHTAKEDSSGVKQQVDSVVMQLAQRMTRRKAAEDANKTSILSKQCDIMQRCMQTDNEHETGLHSCIIIKIQVQQKR